MVPHDVSMDVLRGNYCHVVLKYEVFTVKVVLDRIAYVLIMVSKSLFIDNFIYLTLNN